MKLFKGVATAIVTPFRNGKIDYQSFGNLIDWQISEGINALVVCGTTGEASTLSFKEKIDLLSFAVSKVNKRVPLIAGTGCNDTAKAMLLSEEAEDVGVDGLLVVTPYYNKCNDDGLIEYYTSIANYVNIPIIMYSVKSRTGVNIKPEVVKKLSKVKNIIGIKEASNDISQICEIAKYVDKNFSLYSGNDDNTLPVLALGGMGVISTVSNVIPNKFVKMTDSFFNKDLDTAKKIQLSTKTLIDAMFMDVNPIPVKAALNMMGKIKAEYRSPLTSPDDKTKNIIYNALKSHIKNI